MFRQHPLDLHATQVNIQHDLHHPKEQQQYQHRDHAGGNDHHGNRLDKVIQGILHLLYQIFGRNCHIFHDICHRIFSAGNSIFCPVEDISNRAGRAVVLLLCILCCSSRCSDSGCFRRISVIRHATVFQYVLGVLGIFNSCFDLGLIGVTDEVGNLHAGGNHEGDRQAKHRQFCCQFSHGGICKNQVEYPQATGNRNQVGKCHIASNRHKIFFQIDSAEDHQQISADICHFLRDGCCRVARKQSDQRRSHRGCRRQLHDSLFFLIQRGDGLLMILRCGDVFSYNRYG